MDKSVQNSTENKLAANEVQLWLPPSFTKNKVSVETERELERRGRIKWGFADKVVWDWLLLASQVLGAIAIPFVILVIGWYYTQQTTQQQLLLSERQYQTNQQIVIDQQHETVLESCTGNIRDLLLNKGLGTSKPGDEVRVVARAEVLSALQQLDGKRKGTLISFLSEAGLITDANNRPAENKVIISLAHADLSKASLNLISLAGTDLSFADLSGAQLEGADLSYASLYGTHLRRADLLATRLKDTDLVGADLRGANLRSAELYGAILDCLDPAFCGNVGETKLDGADLSFADLANAFITQEQLAQAKSLYWAFMPDGSRHP